MMVPEIDWGDVEEARMNHDDWMGCLAVSLVLLGFVLVLIWVIQSMD